MPRPLIYGFDFDGTLVKHNYPKIGDIDTDMFMYARELKRRGNKLILITQREGSLLKEAVDFCHKQGLHFNAVNDNLPEIIDFFGCNPRKIFCNVFVDDRNMSVEEFKERMMR